jgi:DNA invertase Pin-like site-specific DNA recombinase
MAMSPARKPKSETPKRAVSYLRVSTQRQADKDFNPEGFSLPSQRQLNERKAAEMNATIVREFIDSGGSGRNINRKDLQRMLAYLKEDGGVDYVIVSYIDRFARRLRDHVLVKLAIEQTGAKLVSATENIDDSDAGQLIEGVLAVVAEFQSNHNVGKVKSGMQRKAESGGTPGRAPIGYLNLLENYDGRSIRVVKPDPERAPLVRWAFEAYATGNWTITKLADTLNSRGLRTRSSGRRGVRPLATSNVAFMLGNPYYVGVVVHNGVEYPGRHEALIDRVLYDKVQEVLASHSCGEKQVKYRRYLTSTLYCGYCGNRLCFSRNRGHGGTYDYWICLGRQQRRAPCPQRYLRDDVVDAEVTRYWQRVRLSEKSIAEIQNGIDEYLELIREGSGDKVAELKLRIGKLRGQERELLALRYEEAVSRELFTEEQRRIASDIAVAESEITKLELVEVDFGALYAKAADLLRNFGELYEGAPPTVRRQCNRAIFSHLYFQGPTVSGARLTKLGAGLLHGGAEGMTWGTVPANEDEPKEDEDESQHWPNVVFLRRGSREENLVPPAV